MLRKSSVVIAILIAFSIANIVFADTESIPEFCVEGVHAGGADYLICVPDNWNDNLIVYAHGYVAFNEPIGIPWDQLVLPDGTSIPEIMTDLGFAFATTSYSTNGLAIKQGLVEVVDLVSVFESMYSTPDLVFLGGVSEGGLITALAIEQYPDVFDGGLSTCGPIGDFRGQINYFGDFRVVFDYFFPALLPPSPVDIPPELIDEWETTYLPSIFDAVQANPMKTINLLNITGAAYDFQDSSTILQTVERMLWYNAFATNDGIDKLEGQPFDNMDRFYSGFLRNRTLNRRVERFSADQVALDNIETDYQTTGSISIPLVTIHTTGDEIVPYWHETLYREKILKNRAGSLYTHIPVVRYGHCNFELIEVLAGFGLLLLETTGEQIAGIQSILPNPESINAYSDILQTYSPHP
jgi:pimeloyl-ACP methyl ester carboxylesterase